MILKDPNKPALLLYDVPSDETDEEEEDEAQSQSGGEETEDVTEQ